MTWYVPIAPVVGPTGGRGVWSAGSRQHNDRPLGEAPWVPKNYEDMKNLSGPPSKSSYVHNSSAHADLSLDTIWRGELTGASELVQMVVRQ